MTPIKLTTETTQTKDLAYNLTDLLWNLGIIQDV